MFCNWAWADTQVIAATVADPDTGAAVRTFDVPPVIGIGGVAFSVNDKTEDPSIRLNTDIRFWNNSSEPVWVATTKTLDDIPKFASLSPPAINSGGKVAFWGQTATTEKAGIWTYVWAETGGTLTKVDLQGETYTLLSVVAPPLLSNNGEVAFRATATDGTKEYAGLWAFGKAIAVEGRPAGSTGGVFIAGIDNSPALANNLVAFRAAWDGGTGVWRAGTDDTPTPIAKVGDSGPGGSTISALGAVLASNSGHVIFKADLEGGTATAAIFRNHVSSLQVETVVSTLDTKEPISKNAFLSLETLAANQRGEVAFTGSYDPDPQKKDDWLAGVWKKTVGGLERVAVQGSDVRGMAGQVIPGVTFDLAFPRVAINDNGLVAFIGQMTGTDINAGNDDGLWAEDPSGNLRLIVREGDSITVKDNEGNDVSRIVSSINFAGVAGGFDGYAAPLAFDANNRLVYHVRFVGGSEAILVTVVPEPAHLALVALSALLLRRQRRARTQ
jgi:hypothetical protein